MKSFTEKIFDSEKFVYLNQSNLLFTGLRGSLDAFIIAKNFLQSNKLIFCSEDQQKLFRLKDDLSLIVPERNVFVYLSKFDEEFEENVSPLSAILNLLTGEHEDEHDFILLTDTDSLNKEIISGDEFKKHIIKLRKGDEFLFEELLQKLREFGFRRKNIVEEENDYSIRGGIVDVFPENLSQPVRIEFFGETVESIREFDISAQRSIGQLNETEILPPFELIDKLSSSKKLYESFDQSFSFMIDEPDEIKDKDEILFANLQSHKTNFISALSNVTSISPSQKISFDSKQQPSFNSNIKSLMENLHQMKKDDFEIHLACSDDYQAKRMKEIIDDEDESNELSEIIYHDNSFHYGFVLPEIKLTIYTEHEIFSRYYKPQKKRTHIKGITFKELAKINNGDFMVHHNFGIGKYLGLKRIKVGGVQQEAVKLLYEDNDSVFVNLNSLHLIKKFSAQEGVHPRLSKLGSAEWERLKQRTKKKIQEIAKDLILLYAKRKSQKGFRFSSDTVWQKELEASFMYEDTPDQITATQSVKLDMESESPMDRLVCGDVGFGKTEVAVRAAFKAVNDNKQAGVLVPTTILAEQHYNTFKDRLSNWAVEVEHLSRFKTKKEQKEILERLEAGKINIIIGTHRLLSKDVKFKALALLVIDEEQRFGVTAKEKLKMMRENIDVLTLTATPIPRTMNFSLLGARDLSLINTPPKNRQPIHTEIITFDENKIRNAVLRELQRNGQVYFVNDRISKLDDIARTVEELVPFAKVGIAHGQMAPAHLEKVMLKFLEKKIDVLCCTKIIESGLDIPSVNTIIINRANNFGLAELYQLRGRVGRSNIKSFAYLITPPQSILTKQAVRRLQALEEFSDLGSGMNLALRDLEIRGAGNLLGSEQSGFISEMGFDTYMQILDEAIDELRESELGEAMPEIKPKEKPVEKKLHEVTIETDVSAYISEDYIEDENARLEIYQRLSKANANEEVIFIKEELLDRFGKLPDEVEQLFKQVELKIILASSQFNKFTLHKNDAELFFNMEDESIFKEGKLERIVSHLNSSDTKNIQLSQTRASLSLKLKLETDDRIGEAEKYLALMSR